MALAGVCDARGANSVLIVAGEGFVGIERAFDAGGSAPASFTAWRWLLGGRPHVALILLRETDGLDKIRIGISEEEVSEHGDDSAHAEAADERKSILELVA